MKRGVEQAFGPGSSAGENNIAPPVRNATSSVDHGLPEGFDYYDAASGWASNSDGSWQYHAESHIYHETATGQYYEYNYYTQEYCALASTVERADGEADAPPLETGTTVVSQVAVGTMQGRRPKQEDRFSAVVHMGRTYTHLRRQGPISFFGSKGAGGLQDLRIAGASRDLRCREPSGSKGAGGLRDLRVPGASRTD
ncbi:hypothetical protein CYMTET_28802 [Cymbomonas tetramitiformis]|uniref:OCRE domain-containing protein n=1 Tax=Cymbomonas tetramitiformis TaxID=36881 RepID=A0AAE0FM76_9CHLO|nr:hypothetical protein CYMTET_28802 [Cymbomonas tetramitiformis]